MGTIKRFRLNSLSADELKQKEMDAIRGGYSDSDCGCGCIYQDSNGSNIYDNGNANKDYGYSSSYNSIVYTSDGWNHPETPTGTTGRF